VRQLNHIIAELTESFDKVSKCWTSLNVLQTDQHLTT